MVPMWQNPACAGVLVISLYRYVNIDSCNTGWRKMQGYHHGVYLGGFLFSFCQEPVSVVM